MNYQLELQLLGLAGLAVHYLKNYAEYNQQGKKYELGKSLPTILLSAICTGLLIYLRKDIEGLYVITPFSALVLGYFGNSVFFSFIKAKEPNLTKAQDLQIDEIKRESNEGGSKPPEEGRPDKP